MGTHYQHLSAEERATIMILLQQGCSARGIARTLRRSPSTVTREIRRALDWPQRSAFVPAGSGGCTYDARAAGARACAMRLKRRRHPKLAEDGVLFGVVHHFVVPEKFIFTPPLAAAGQGWRHWTRLAAAGRATGR